MRGAHPVQPGGQIQQNARAEKTRKPVLELQGSSATEESWEYFVHRFEDYKTLAGINARNAATHLRDCLPYEIGLMLHSTYGSSINNQDEKTLLANVKRLAVKTRNKLAAVVEMVQLKQEPEQQVEAYVAKLKMTARQCGFKMTKKCVAVGCDQDNEFDFSDLSLIHI